MANVGTLTIELQASLAKFQQDLGKAVASSEKAAASITSAFKGIAAGIAGGIGVGFVFQEIIDSAKDTIKAAAALNDLSDITGSTVENLSKLANQTKISGASFEELQGALEKLSVGMGGTGEKSERVAAVLKTLGVSAKDPAEALQQIAISLSKYEDGATKAAYANVLFGKSGAAFLATLKDIANLQDVAATTTTKQAQESEKLEQAYRRISAEATVFKNAILSDVVPPLLRVITEFNEARKAGLGFWESLKLIGSGQTSIDERIESTTRSLKAAQEALETGKHPGALITNPFYNFAKDVEKYTKDLQVLKAVRASTLDYSAFDKEKLAKLPPLPATGGGRGSKEQKERISDAQRYIEQLQQQLQKTEELTVVETILADIEAGRFKVTEPGQARLALALGEQIDAAKAQVKARQESEKLAADEARTREQTSRLTQNAIKAAQDETGTLAEQNQHMKEEIELIGKDAISVAALMQARLDSAIALKQETLAIQENAGAEQALIDATKDQIRLLQERKGILVGKGIAEGLAEDAAKAKEINDIFVNSFADGVTSIVTGTKSISSAFKDMEKQIVASISRIASQKIAESIFGGATSSGGGGIFASIGPMLASLFGGGGTSPTAFQFGRASGGPVAANQPYMVGESGRELFVPKQSGTIIPNSALSSGRSSIGSTVNISVNVMPGASRATADQAALQTGVAVQRALARNG